MFDKIFEQLMNDIHFDNELSELLYEMKAIHIPRLQKLKWPLRGYIPPKNLRLPMYNYYD